MGVYRPLALLVERAMKNSFILIAQKFGNKNASSGSITPPHKHELYRLTKFKFITRSFSSLMSLKVLMMFIQVKLPSFGKKKLLASFSLEYKKNYLHVQNFKTS